MAMAESLSIEGPGEAEGRAAVTAEIGCFLDPVLAKLTALLGGGYNFSKKIQGNIACVISELIRVRSPLVSMGGSSEDPDAAGNGWITQARELSNHMMDQMDSFIHGTEGVGDSRDFFFCEETLVFQELEVMVRSLVFLFCKETGNWRIIFDTGVLLKSIIAKLTSLLGAGCILQEKTRRDIKIITSVLELVHRLLLTVLQGKDYHKYIEWVMQVRDLSDVMMKRDGDSAGLFVQPDKIVSSSLDLKAKIWYLVTLFYKDIGNMTIFYATMKHWPGVTIAMGFFLDPVLAKITDLLSKGYVIPEKTHIEFITSQFELLHRLPLIGLTMGRIMWMMDAWDLSNCMMDEIDSFMKQDGLIVQPETIPSPFLDVKNEVRSLVARFCKDRENRSMIVSTLMKMWPAVTIATGAMGPVQAKLIALLGDGYMLQEKTRSDIEFITSDLDLMHRFFLTTLGSEYVNPKRIEWMAKVRDLSYVMMDYTDNFIRGMEKPGDSRSLLEPVINNMRPFGELRDTIRCLLTEFREGTMKDWRISVESMKGWPSVTVPTGALGPVLAKLTALLGHGYMFSEMIRSEIKLLISDLEPIYSLLLRMWIKREDPDAACNDWAEWMWRFSNRMEDSINSFMSRYKEFASKRPSRIKHSSSVSGNFIYGIRNSLVRKQQCCDKCRNILETMKGCSTAVTVGTGYLGPVLWKLTTLLERHRYNNIPEVEESQNDIEFIEAELRPVYSLLLKKWEMVDVQSAFKDWMIQARDLSFQMANLIDDFLRSLERGDRLWQQGTNRSPFGELREQVVELVGRCHKEWKPDPETISSHSSYPMVDPRSRFHHKHVSKLIDMQKMQMLIKLVQQHQTVCIHGFGGMGKTTLADFVWQAIGEQFDCRAFLSVSSRPNMEQIQATMVSEFIVSAIIKAGKEKRNVAGSAPLVSIPVEDHDIHIRNAITGLFEHMLLVDSDDEPHARPRVSDDIRKNHIDRVSQLLLDKRKVIATSPLGGTSVAQSHGSTSNGSDSDFDSDEFDDEFDDEFVSSPLGGTSVADEQYLMKIVLELLEATLSKNICRSKGSDNDDSDDEFDDDFDDDFDYDSDDDFDSDSNTDREFKKQVLPKRKREFKTQEECIVHLTSKFLADRRYLVIVDDICDWKHWESIRRILPKNPASRIIKTTRVYAIACRHRTDNSVLVYGASGLSLPAATTLSEKVFKECCQIGIDPSDMRRQCSSIAHVSRGMPLAVICMSAAFAEKLKEVYEPKPGPDSPRLSDQFRKAERLTLEGFLKIECLKPLVEIFCGYYDDLPLHLKSCLLHCTVYPPNRILERDDLIRLWITEGLVDEEEKAESYVAELVNRGLIWSYSVLAAPKYEINTLLLHFLKRKSELYHFSAYYDSGHIPSQDAKRISRLSVHSYTNKAGISQLHGSSKCILGHAPLKQFERLQVLHLDHSHLNSTDLVDMDICGLRLLRCLSLKGTRINVLPLEIGGLEHLQTLDVGGTGILVLPSEIGQLQDLEILDVSNTMVAELPTEIGKLKLMKILNARNSRLTKLPAEIKKLQHLETLDVRNTVITELPGEIGKLKCLKTLNISNTVVVDLPMEITKLDHLETLDASNTKLTKVPREIGKMKCLKNLNISHTGVTELPMEISELHQLETLDVSHTNITKLPIDSEQHQRLKTLNICNTEVRELSWKACPRSNSISVLVGDNDSPKIVKILEEWILMPSEKSLTEHGISTISLLDIFGQSWEPISTARFKVASRDMKIPNSFKTELNNISTLEISLWKVEDEDLKILRNMTNLIVLALRVEVPLTRPTAISNPGIDIPQRKQRAITCEGFQMLEEFYFDCPVPQVNFEAGAMGKLKHLEFKFYAFRATEGCMGIRHLKSLERVVFRSASGYKSNVPGISDLINEVREEAKKHKNRITLCVNDNDPEVFRETSKTERSSNRLKTSDTEPIDASATWEKPYRAAIKRAESAKARSIRRKNPRSN